MGGKGDGDKCQSGERSEVRGSCTIGGTWACTMSFKLTAVDIRNLDSRIAEMWPCKSFGENIRVEAAQRLTSPFKLGAGDQSEQVAGRK